MSANVSSSPGEFRNLFLNELLKAVAIPNKVLAHIKKATEEVSLAIQKITIVGTAEIQKAIAERVKLYDSLAPHLQDGKVNMIYCSIMAGCKLPISGSPALFYLRQHDISTNAKKQILTSYVLEQAIKLKEQLKKENPEMLTYTKLWGDLECDDETPGVAQAESKESKAKASAPPAKAADTANPSAITQTTTEGGGGLHNAPQASVPAGQPSAKK